MLLITQQLNSNNNFFRLIVPRLEKKFRKFHFHDLFWNFCQKAPKNYFLIKTTKFTTLTIFNAIAEQFNSIFQLSLTAKTFDFHQFARSRPETENEMFLITLNLHWNIFFGFASFTNVNISPKTTLQYLTNCLIDIKRFAIS